TDRRLLNQRVKQINKRLEKVRKQREQGRQSRQKAEIPTVSLVGYTNAGKSTLFNHLTDAHVLAADQLFATLDPTLRRVELPGGYPMILADTVGFIRHLPHDLIAAFRSTLQETEDADLLLHVIDASDPERQDKIEQVNEVLREIDAHEIPQIEVYNKIDCVEMAEPRLERDESGRVRRAYVSAVSGEGLELLLKAIAEMVHSDTIHRELRLPPAAGRLRAQLYEMGTVRSEHIDSSGDWLLDVEIKQQNFDHLRKQPEFTSWLESA
ncbi:MAG: GTPase HflX, partial [Gammaproteobacteria bacterium]|nr:GTPase HflX [Gammaproteobacteria bacterium]